MEVKTGFCKRLKALRKSKGLTQAALAEKADISHRYYQDIEMGKMQDPGAQKILKLAQSLDVSTEFLLTGFEATAKPQSPPVTISPEGLELIIDGAIDRTMARLEPKIELLEGQILSLESENKALKTSIRDLDPEVLMALRDLEPEKMLGIRILLGLNGNGNAKKKKKKTG